MVKPTHTPSGNFSGACCRGLTTFYPPRLFGCKSGWFAGLNPHPGLNIVLNMIWGRVLVAWAFLLALAQAQDCVPKALTAEQHTPSYFRYSFLVDTSSSMFARGDGQAVIFPQLQARLLSFVRDIRGRAEVWITPFSQVAAPTARFELPRDRQDLESYLGSLEASGADTWLYRSLQETLKELPPDPDVGNVIVILTDGIDNDPQPLGHCGRMAVVQENTPAYQGKYSDLANSLPHSLFVPNHTFHTGC